MSRTKKYVDKIGFILILLQIAFLNINLYNVSVSGQLRLRLQHLHANFLIFNSVNSRRKHSLILQNIPTLMVIISNILCKCKHFSHVHLVINKSVINNKLLIKYFYFFEDILKMTIVLPNYVFQWHWNFSVIITCKDDNHRIYLAAIKIYVNLAVFFLY